MKTRLTPVEIQQQKFKTGFRGYNTVEVDQFLDEVSETVRSVLAENESLKENAQQVSKENQELKAREDAYKRLMLNSQKVVEQMKENSRKSAEVIVAQAEMDAGKIMQSAHDRLIRMHEEISELKRQKIRLRNQIKSILATHLELLEIEEAEPEPAAVGLEDNGRPD
jgi:cell division initiation protein